MKRREFIKKAGLLTAGASIPQIIQNPYFEGNVKKLEEITTNPLNLDPLYEFNQKDLQKFNSWVDLTLNESKENKSNSIIINKSAHKLYLIREGQIDSVYDIEIGSRPFLDKEKEGDFKTPEGLYLVKRKLVTPHTRFHKAYLWDYPNKQDRELRKTGSLIEIHGMGSGLSPSEGGFDWTHGCTAMSNEDIDKIFPYINEKDRITSIRYTDKKLS